MEDLQREMVLIREALNKLQCEETFIVQGRTRRHHVIAIPERTNHPSQWSTRCGWKYGHGKLYRTNIVQSDATRCARCFQLEQEAHNEPSPASLSLPVTILIPPADLAVAVGVLVFLASLGPILLGRGPGILHRPRETQPSARNFETVSEHVPGV